MKKLLTFIIISTIAISCSACGSGQTEIERLKKENNELKQQLNGSSETTTQTTSTTPPTPRELKQISLGETISVQTESGDFEIAIDRVHKTDIYDDTSDIFAATIQCVVNNISYSSDLYPNMMKGYDVAEEHDYVQLTDRNGIAFPFYSISGPTDGAYAVSHKLPIGSKARESYPFLVPVGTVDVSVIINNQYVLNTVISE